MFKSFKRQLSDANNHLLQNLLSPQELNELRFQATQINSSTRSNHQLTSRQTGNLTTRALGSGMDYAESRSYQQGDDPRSINWRLSARSQETFVKTYHIEARPSLNILLDRRKSMVFGTRRRLKITQAVRVATLLAYASEIHQLNFQAWILDEQGLQHFDQYCAKGYNNHTDFLQEANQAAKPHQPLSNDLKQKQNIGDALKSINQQLAHGDLLYLLSDFSDLDISHQTRLAELNERCFTQAIQIIDPAEQHLGKLGKIRLQSLTKPNNYQIDTHLLNNLEKFSKQTKQIINDRERLITDIGLSYFSLLAEVEDIQNAVSLPLGQA